MEEKNNNWQSEGFGGGKSAAKLCSICGAPYGEFGNNPQPVIDDFDARCCDDCNQRVVIPARMRRMSKGLSAY